jgi:hypothetical protein
MTFAFGVVKIPLFISRAMAQGGLTTKSVVAEMRLQIFLTLKFVFNLMFRSRK